MTNQETSPRNHGGDLPDPDYDFFDYISDCLQNYDLSKLDNNQEDFIRYMDLCRNYSWDIPSALPCDHLDDIGIDDFPMHHRNWADPQQYPNLASYVLADNHAWDIIDLHFKDIHGLDLTDPAINWNFDT
jgi:hypothetical protein